MKTHLQRRTVYTPRSVQSSTLADMAERIASELYDISLALNSDTLVAGDSRHGTTDETGLLLWVRQAVGGTPQPVLERVTLGANNSGGAGYRLLRIPNST